jgi:uncharacterized protein
MTGSAGSADRGRGAAQLSGFEWDIEKERQNLLKHGIDFTTAAAIWGGRVFETPDDRRDYGGQRIVALGRGR